MTKKVLIVLALVGTGVVLSNRIRGLPVIGPKIPTL